MARLFVFLLFASVLWAFSLGGRNWLDYRGAWKGHSHFEDRVWASLSSGDFSAGVLFWAKEPSRLDQSGEDTISAAIAQYWFSFYSPRIELTAGSFTYTLGQGILIDLYDRADIQIDHHCDGASFKLRLPHLELSGFSGIARWDDDALVRGAEGVLSLLGLRGGVEYGKIIPKLSAAQELFGAFLAAESDFLSLWVEAGRKNALGGLVEDGTAVYASATAILGTFSFTAEYKDYRHFAVRTPAIQYNNPPTLIREPSYTLPSRHLRQLDANDELGFAARAEGAVGSLGGEAFFGYAQRHDGGRPFTQLWLEAELTSSDETAYYKLALDYSDDAGERRVTPIVDITAEPGWTRLGFNLVGEYQRSGERNNVFASFAVSFAPYATVGVDGGYVDDEAFVRLFSDIDAIERAKVRLGLGKRPGGFTCSGGVCRYEPPFEGVELQIVLTY